MKHILQNIRIEKIGYGGIGIARNGDGKKILISGGALPGSVVDCRIVAKKKDYIQAHIVSIKSYDPTWSDGEIFCPHYFIPLEVSADNQGSHKIGCGGCKRQILSYTKQLEVKEMLVRDCMRKFGGLDIRPIISSPLQRGYRNKIEFSFGTYISKKENIDSRWNIGFHKQGEFSKIVDIDNCGLITQEANQLYVYIKQLCSTSGLSVYDQKKHHGIFRHLVLRQGIRTGQFLVHLVVADQEFDNDIQALWLQFREKVSKDEYLQKTVDTRIVSYNNGLADVIKTTDIRTEIWRGKGYIYEKLLLQDSTDSTYEMHCRISTFSFFQTNTLGAEQLFNHAAKLCNTVKGDILDLYCGTGTIGLSFLKMGIGKNLVGVDTVDAAIADAWHNAEINGLSGRSNFFSCAAEKLFTHYPQLQDKITTVGLIIVDPPRDGLHKYVVDFMINMKKENSARILYISCNPITLARDIEHFVQMGIQPKLLQPLDMFPHTHHIELICIL